MTAQNNEMRTKLLALYPDAKNDFARFLEALNFIEKKRPQLARHFKAYKLRWGLEGQRPYTFKEIAMVFGISSTRVQQLVKRPHRMLLHENPWRHLDGLPLILPY